MSERFLLSMAGRTIAVEATCPDTIQLFRRYLAPEDASPDFTVVITEADIEEERQLCVTQGVSRPLTVSWLEYSYLYHRIMIRMIEYDTFMMHGSSIAVDGRGYIFTAPSGTGKSTHTALWCRALGERAVMVNDDKPMIRIEKDQIMICGTPWNGKNPDLGCNMMVPLKAVCFLKRAEENRLIRMKEEDLIPNLLQQVYCYKTPEELLRTLKLLDRMLEKVPVWQLEVNNYREDAFAVSSALISDEN